MVAKRATVVPSGEAYLRGGAASRGGVACGAGGRRAPVGHHLERGVEGGVLLLCARVLVQAGEVDEHADHVRAERAAQEGQPRGQRRAVGVGVHARAPAVSHEAHAAVGGAQRGGRGGGRQEDRCAARALALLQVLPACGPVVTRWDIRVFTDTSRPCTHIHTRTVLARAPRSQLPNMGSSCRRASAGSALARRVAQSRSRKAPAASASARAGMTAHRTWDLQFRAGAGKAAAGEGPAFDPRSTHMRQRRSCARGRRAGLR